MNRFEKYSSYYEEYSKKYGKKTIVLMIVGRFYEIYQFGRGPNLDDLQILLNLRKARHNQDYFLGFPIHTVEKYVKILINNDYTVVIIDKQIEIHRKYQNNMPDEIDYNTMDNEIMTIII